MVFQPIHPFSGIQGAVEELSDLEFLRDTELLGDIQKVVGSRNSTGVIISFTPANGITFFFLSATLSPGTATSRICHTDIRNNGVVRDHLSCKIGGGAQSDVSTVVDDSHQRIDKLIGDGALIYDLNIVLISGASNFNATLEGWTQTT